MKIQNKRQELKERGKSIIDNTVLMKIFEQKDIICQIGVHIHLVSEHLSKRRNNSGESITVFSRDEVPKGHFTKTAKYILQKLKEFNESTSVVESEYYTVEDLKKLLKLIPTSA